MQSKTMSSIFEETLALQTKQESHYRFSLELVVVAAILFGSFMVRVSSLTYNTLFLDEAINAMIGRDILRWDFSRNALLFHFGSYLYPILSALLNQVGGVVAMRLASTVLMCVTALFVYLTTKTLFGQKAGLVSLILFSFNGNILNLGQLAVYDALALPLLSAAYFLMVTAITTPVSQKHSFYASAACATLAVLAKYVGLIYLPALCITALVLFWLKGTPLRQALPLLLKSFILPIVYILSLYAALNWRELIQVFQSQGFSPAPQGLIIKIIFQEIGFIMMLAIVGVVWFGLRAVQNQNLFAWMNRSQSDLTLISRVPKTLLMSLTILLMLCTWLASPLLQWLTANDRSLWKNCAYSLVFLAPLAGYCVARFIDSIRSRQFAINIMGAALLCLMFVYFANSALDTNWSFQQSWPNITGAVTYLREHGLSQDSRILAEDMDVYEYYFALAKSSQPVWNNFWYMDYGGESGQAGTLAAIHARAFDFIIIDDYYFPGIREQITPLLSESGYVVGWEDEQKLRSDDKILLQVYIRSDGGSQ